MGGRLMDGRCTICGETLGKDAIVAHVQGHLAPTGSDEIAGGRAKALLQLLVEGADEPEYWMFLEARGDAPLLVLDRFLRDEWLECSGHLSEFTIGGRHYPSDDEDMEWAGEAMGAVTLGGVLTDGDAFEHEYDLGTPTNLDIRVVGTRKGLPHQADVALLARNESPDRPCEECGRPAEYVCTSHGEGPDAAWLCAECVAGHDDHEGHVLPVTNSPRGGVCAYTGVPW